MAAAFMVGESLVGEGNEVAHNDHQISSKSGPVGDAYANTHINHNQAVARAVVDSVRDGVIAEGDIDDLAIIVGVFIHWEATDDKKIFDYNYQATKEALARALGNEPSVSSILDSSEAARHPFAGGVEA